MRKSTILILLCLFNSILLFSQVAINNDGTLPNNAAMLDVKSIDKGVLLPRMTASQMDSISSPPNGLIVYNTTVNALFWYNGSIWNQFNEFNFTETDPIFEAHPASGITTSDISQWNNAYSNRITSATGTSPLNLSLSNYALSGSINAANSLTNGYLTSTDWNSFNDKVSSQWITSGQDISYTQGKVGIGTSTPSNSALVDMSSTTKGVLLPRMTLDQRNAIAGTVEGLMVYCTDCGSDGALSIFSNDAWRTFSPCSAPATYAEPDIISPGQIIWNWTAVAGADGYKWNTTGSYGTATDMGTATSKTETGIACNTTYNRYVWTYNSCGVSEPVILTETTPAASPATPPSGTHVSTDVSVVWNWNSVTDAAGYKWNTTDDFGSATNMGIATTKSETGLICGTPYTRYAWAYNGCGYSTSATLTQSTLDCWTCGNPLTIDHVAGSVAPVTKTVTYGTVTNILGETSKCWITQNLGADHQAIAVSDATEASAGWYWQFNRMQGYKHDGTTRTPNTTWIGSISEDSEWLTANDPCALLLGAGWRLPTYTEWNNVDASGGWTNWNGPWSALKMHAAGRLDNNNGSLYYRGANGYYWSSTQGDNSFGWSLYFTSVYCNMNLSHLKAFGFPSRCLRD